MKIYILTREHNEYDQYGEYFVAWFSKKPSAFYAQCAIKHDDGSEVTEELANHILSGGGRQTDENVWWHLRMVSSPNGRALSGGPPEGDTSRPVRGSLPAEAGMED